MAKVRFNASTVRGFEVEVVHDGLGNAVVPSPVVVGTRHSDDETISGALNGSNDVFVLARTPSPAASLRLYWNGICLKRNVGYTLSGATVTMQPGYTPATGDSLVAFFRY